MDVPADQQKLAQLIGHSFSSPSLLRQALTHSSQSRSSRTEDNQRLEFLGDRVLGLIVSDMLYHTFKVEPEGDLARRLAALVRQERLAEVAGMIDLGSYLHMSRGEHEAGGRANPAILADACEAVIGALYLDGGLTVARPFIEAYWSKLMHAEVRPPQDSKTSLQEWAQGRGLPLPLYRLVGNEGPAHDPTFLVEVTLPGYEAALAKGKSKRQAEQVAAAKLLALIEPGR